MFNFMQIFAALIGRFLFKDMILHSLFIDWCATKFFLLKRLYERHLL